MEKSLNELFVDIKSNYEQFIDLSEQFIDKQKQLEQPKFKRGDFFYFQNSVDRGLRWIGIFSQDSKKENSADYFVLFCVHNNKLLFDSYAIKQNSRFATDSEKQLLLDKLHEQGKEWDAEKMEIVDYAEKIKRDQQIYRVLQKEKRFETALWLAIEDRYYEYDEFKTKELAQEACDKLNEVLKTLKHY